MTGERLSVSVVIPTYNERENIALLIPALRRELRGRTHELIVVDDSSPDGTADAARALAPPDELRVIVKPRKEGIGAALRVGYDAARHDVLVSMDADLSFPVDGVPRLIAGIEAGQDLVLGSRHMPGGAYVAPNASIRLKRIASGVGNFVLRRVTGLPLHDFSANFRAIRREAWHSIQTRENTNSLLVEMVVETARQGYRVGEVPVVFSDRRHGQSKLNLWLEIPKAALRLGTILSPGPRVRPG